MIEPVNSRLDGTLSLVDKVWNDAMETAALRCLSATQTLRGMNGESEAWVWAAAKYCECFAQDFREMKRGLK